MMRRYFLTKHRISKAPIDSFGIGRSVIKFHLLDPSFIGTYIYFQNKYSSPDHAKMVAENAKRAITWLKDRPANTKGVTSRGEVLPSLSVTSEEYCAGDGKNNDDIILDVCVAMSSSVSSKSDERRDNLRVVKRDVVLLTDDRNLKLKAHMSDVPVNTIPDFVRWAFPSSTSNN